MCGGSKKSAPAPAPEPAPPPTPEYQFRDGVMRQGLPETTDQTMASFGSELGK